MLSPFPLLSFPLPFIPLFALLTNINDRGFVRLWEPSSLSAKNKSFNMHRRFWFIKSLWIFSLRDSINLGEIDETRRAATLLRDSILSFDRFNVGIGINTVLDRWWYSIETIWGGGECIDNDHATEILLIKFVWCSFKSSDFYLSIFLTHFWLSTF